MSRYPSNACILTSLENHDGTAGKEGRGLSRLKVLIGVVDRLRAMVGTASSSRRPLRPGMPDRSWRLAKQIRKRRLSKPHISITYLLESPWKISWALVICLSRLVTLTLAARLMEDFTEP